MSSAKIINVQKDDKLEDILPILSAAGADEIILVLPKRGKFLNKQAHFDAVAEAATAAKKTVSILCSNPDINSRALTAGFAVLEQKKTKTVKPEKTAPAGRTVTASSPPPADDEVFDDSADAFTEDVIVPSDEKIGIEDEEEEEHSGVRIIEPDEMEDEDAEAEKLDKDAEDEEAELPEDIEEPGSTRDNDIEEFYNSGKGGTADFLAAGVKNSPVALKAATRLSRGLDAVVRPDSADTKNLKVKSLKEKPASVEVVSEKVEAEKEMDEVWQDTQPADKKIESLWRKASAFSVKRYRPSRTGPGRFPRTRYILIVGALILAAAGGVFAYPKSAVITLKPTSQELNLQTRVEITDSASSVDLDSGKIPGQVFSLEHTVKENFPASGQKEVAQKARGLITIYNEYGTTPQTLIATTRFESDNGLIFRTLQTVNVPGTKVENGKIIPGSVNVEIIADKPGTTYNIGPGKFTIPAFKEKGDNDRYQKFYGQSAAAFTKGVSGMAKVVTEADYNKARETVTNKLKDELSKMMTEKAGELKMLGATDVVVKKIESTAEADQAADSFTVTAAGMIRVMGYKEADLLEFIKQSVKKKYSMLTVQDKLTYSLAAANVPADKSSVITALQAKGYMFSEINTAKVADDLRGKGEADSKIYLRDLTGITNARVTFDSLTGKSMPRDPSKIKVVLVYE